MSLNVSCNLDSAIAYREQFNELGSEGVLNKLREVLGQVLDREGVANWLRKNLSYVFGFSVNGGSSKKLTGAQEIVEVSIFSPNMEIIEVTGVE